MRLREALDGIAATVNSRDPEEDSPPGDTSTLLPVMLNG